MRSRKLSISCGRCSILLYTIHDPVQIKTLNGQTIHIIAFIHRVGKTGQIRRRSCGNIGCRFSIGKSDRWISRHFYGLMKFQVELDGIACF